MTTKKKKRKKAEKRKAEVRRDRTVSGGKAPAPKVPTQDIQLRPNYGQGPYTKYFNSYVPRKVEATFYEFLREAIPLVDAAIQRLTELDGHLIVTGGKDKLVEEVQDWMDNVPVNDIQTGLQAYDNNFTGEAHEQGFAIGEYVANKTRNDIVGLRVADSKFINFKRITNGLEISQKADDDNDYRPLDPTNLMYFSINNENQNPYGTALMRSCEFVSKLLVTIQNSEMNKWERFGDLSFKLVYKTSKKDGKDHKARGEEMKADLNTAIAAKRSGNSADFVYVIDKDSDINIDIIGADDKRVLSIKDPSRHVEEHIIAKTGLAPWMMARHWSTAERLGDAQANMIMAAVRTRQAAKMPRYKNLVKTLLLLRGRTWKPGDWDLEWAQVNLRDAVDLARANFLNSQAEMMRPEKTSDSKMIRRMRSIEDSEKSSISKSMKNRQFHTQEDCPFCSKHATRNPQPGSITKEISRPTPWPELDEVEVNFEKELKYDWSVLEEQVFTIMKLPVDELSTVPKPTPREEQLTNPKSEIRNPKSKAPGDIPDIEAFTFSIEQQAAIMKSLEEFKGKYDWRDTDSAVRWYYGQSYSLGLIQAAHLIGQERPILDLIKNQEIYDEISKNGFTLVKDNATKGIIEKIIPEMQAQVIAGTNPRHVASRLKARFGETNSDWERLARTEMSVAAERAKVDEWKQWKIEKVAFVLAPDGCPICQGLVGEYEIGKEPIPGLDSHPRCRCTLVPV